MALEIVLGRRQTRQRAVGPDVVIDVLEVVDELVELLDIGGKIRAGIEFDMLCCGLNLTSWPLPGHLGTRRFVQDAHGLTAFVA